MNHNSFVTPNDILADALSLIQDREMIQNTPGWYRSQVEQALQELGFDTLYALHTKIQSLGPTPKNPYPLPNGCISVRELYVFIGECCDTTHFVPVGWKRNFNDSPRNNGKGTIERRNTYFEGNLPYANIYSGGIHFNEHVLVSYDYYKLIYHGVLTDLIDCPIVPLFARQAVKWWVVYNAVPTLADFGKNPGLRMVYGEAVKHVQDDIDGEWFKAIRRSQQMDKFEKTNMQAYYASFI